MPKDWDRRPSCAPRRNPDPSLGESALEDFINSDYDDTICRLCDGTGEVNGQLCKSCGGKGH
jgi:hypothetical protein